MDQKNYLYFVDELKEHLLKLAEESSSFECSSLDLHRHFQQVLTSPKKQTAAAAPSYKKQAALQTPPQQNITPQVTKPAPKPQNIPQAAPIQAQASMKLAPTKTSSPSTGATTSIAVSQFILEPLKLSYDDALEDVRLSLSKVAPKLQLLLHSLHDIEAKKIKNQWKLPLVQEPCVILIQHPQYLDFFKQIGLAITRYFAPCKVFDLSKFDTEKLKKILSSPSLKLVLATADTMQSEAFLSFYKEIPSQQSKWLDQHPLILLSQPSSYATNPAMKKSLWDELCHTLPTYLSS